MRVVIECNALCATAVIYNVNAVVDTQAISVLNCLYAVWYIPIVQAVRFEPGDIKTVTLVDIAGHRCANQHEHG